MKERKASINAYDSQQRVDIYEKNMKVMHPNRRKMIQSALEFLSFNLQATLKAIDIGIGTGFFSLEFLKKFNNSIVIGIDGANKMIELAKVRLKDFSDNVKFRIGDFRDLPKLLNNISNVDAVFSSFALHHLNMKEKEILLRYLYKIIKKDCWFINADVIIAESKKIEERFQEIRINGILQRAKQAKDPRFLEYQTTRKFLDDLELNENDQPLSLSEDLIILKKVGFQNIDILWKEYREVVLCAQKKD